jgi:hypothetical protein
MKKLMFIAATVLGLAGGCQKLDPVIVDPGEPTGSELELTTLGLPDTNLTITSIDTSGVFPSDVIRFSGFLLLNTVKYDAGPVGIRSEAFSSVYFADRSRPLLVNGKTVGFFGLELMSNLLQPLTINSLSMLRVPYRLRFPGAVRDTSFGFAYVRDLTGAHQPNMLYTWRVPSPMNIDAFSAQVITPDNVQVLAPLGGSVLPRNREMILRWTGKGDLDIIISVVNPLTKKTRPVMKLRPRVNIGKAVVDARILSLLPRERYFAFTFIIANRYERMVVGKFPGTILVQAASVYNSYIEIL